MSGHGVVVSVARVVRGLLVVSVQTGEVGLFRSKYILRHKRFKTNIGFRLFNFTGSLAKCVGYIYGRASLV